MFEEQYTAIADRIDELAERIRALGRNAVGTLEELIKLSSLKEVPGDYPAWDKMVAQLVSDHERIIQTIRTELREDWEGTYGDDGTQDLLTGVMESHEKDAWMLRAILK
jgi:starvation-inducible DNA-binding protein